MVTSRQQLLAYIRQHHYATVDELRRALRMTPANVRHHLKILLDEKSIRVTGSRPTLSRRGRPALIYSPADETDAHNLDRLAAVLLDLLLNNGISPGVYEQILQKMAEEMAAQAGKDGVELKSLTARLNQAVHLLAGFHYQARWEAHQDAPRMIFTHCPYRSILDGHPELCRMDTLILKKLVSAQIQQTDKLSSDLLGRPFCAFRIGD